MMNIIAKFNTPASAKRFIENAFRTQKKSHRIFLGDDDLIWIVTMSIGEKMLRAGYTEINPFE